MIPVVIRAGRPRITAAHSGETRTCLTPLSSVRGQPAVCWRTGWRRPDLQGRVDRGGRRGELAAVAHPGAYAQLEDTHYDWGYRTVPQRHLHGRRIFQPRGKVLGGSSTINYMVYVRGNHADYDGWCDLGNEGWGYEDLLPYFVRMECNQHKILTMARQGRSRSAITASASLCLLSLFRRRRKLASHSTQISMERRKRVAATTK
jgi:choline dehydrogenase-like flavoprotein